MQQRQMQLMICKEFNKTARRVSTTRDNLSMQHHVHVALIVVQI
jgi:hypothetical protein